MIRSDTIQPSWPLGLFARAQLPPWFLVPSYLLLHGVVATCLPDKFGPLSTIFIVLAEWAAIAACLKTAWSNARPARFFWLLMVAAILFHSAAMSLDAVTEMARVPLLNHVPALQILLSMMYSVPLLYAVSHQSDRRVGMVARVIHAILAIAIGALIYVLIFSFLGLNGTTKAFDEVVVTYLFDAIDFFLAGAATIRWLGSCDEQERRFFKILTAFLWINAVLPAVHNRILMHHDYVALDLLIAAPYVVLAVLALRSQVRPVSEPAAGLVRTVLCGSPLFHASALVLLAVFASQTHFYLGLAAAMVGIVGYGILNVFVQNRGLEAEDSLIASNAVLEKLVDLDGLTGIANRRAFNGALDREFAVALRAQRPISLMMIDVDLFKSLNDAKGHLAGDRYLVRIAGVIRESLSRASDFVARYGGEEFAAILPATDGAGAIIAAEKVRMAVASLRLHHPCTDSGIVTVSVGVATFDGSTPGSPAELTGTADNALYMAKREGRNVCVFRRMGPSRGANERDHKVRKTTTTTTF